MNHERYSFTNKGKIHGGNLISMLFFSVMNAHYLHTSDLTSLCGRCNVQDEPLPMETRLDLRIKVKIKTKNSGNQHYYFTATVCQKARQLSRVIHVRIFTFTRFTFILVIKIHHQLTASVFGFFCFFYCDLKQNLSLSHL